MPGRRARTTAGRSGASWNNAWERACPEWMRCSRRLASQAQPDLPVIGVDVAQGEAADGRGPLGVEQDEEPGDAVFGVKGCVVEQPAGLFPAGLGVDDAGRAAPPGGWEVQAGQLLLL